MENRFQFGLSLVIASIPGATLNPYLSLCVLAAGLGIMASSMIPPRGEGNRLKERKDGSTSKER